MIKRLSPYDSMIPVGIAIREEIDGHARTLFANHRAHHALNEGASILRAATAKRAISVGAGSGKPAVYRAPQPYSYAWHSGSFAFIA